MPPSNMVRAVLNRHSTPAPAARAAAPRPVRPARPAPVRPTAPAPAPAPQQGLVRALFIGINYVGSQYQLAGCINDAQNMRAQVAQFFPACKDTRLLTDTTVMKPTRQNILDSLAWLVAGLQPGQNILFHFAGHGGQVRDTNGDEAEGMDEAIYAYEAPALRPITDDEIRAALAAKVPAGSKCFVVLDCCHSGSAVDLRCLWRAPAQNSLSYTEDKNYAKTAGTVVFLSGCADNDVAADTVDAAGRPCGAMTDALLTTWRQYGPAIKFKYLLWDIRALLKGRNYWQVPQLSTGDVYDQSKPFDLGSAA